jgi:hypothetical protein
MFRVVIAVLALLTAGASFAQSQSFSSLEERMSAQDFRQAGLEKLSPEELAALNAWIERSVRLADPAVAAAVAQGQAVNVDTAKPAEASQVGFETARREEFSAHIQGSFSGWSGDTQFVLDNGMVWEQAEDDHFKHKDVDNPSVTITPGAFGSWRLQVEGSNRTTLVKRIR